MRALTAGLFFALACLAGGVEAGPVSRVKGEFSLIDARNGRPLSSKDLRGKLQVVFFGFTHCALTCPLGLSRMRDALELLGADADKVAPLFITTDPARDDAASMRDYAANFSQQIIPLVGSKKALAAAMRSFRLEAQKTAITSEHDYQMDHPAIIYIMDAQGRYAGTVASNTSPEALAERLRKALAK